jgi:hypothetical protein
MDEAQMQAFQLFKCYLLQVSLESFEEEDWKQN